MRSEETEPAPRRRVRERSAPGERPHRARSIRRPPGRALLVPAAVGLCLLLGCAPSREPYRGNILLLTVDALRPDYMSMNGYDRPTTPYLDALLDGGYYFEEAVSPVPRTTPAVASLMTGAYPHGTGVRTLTDPLPGHVTTIAEVLRDAGYQTVAVVTNTMLIRERGLDRGFSVYDMAHDQRIARVTTEAALRQLESLDPGRPVFAWVHYMDPHAPYHTDPNLTLLMDPDYTGPYRLRFGYNLQPGDVEEKHRAFPEDLPKSQATHRNTLAEEVNAHIRRLYAADIRATDAQIERLVESMRDLFGEDLLIIITADHGESLGEHDLHYDHGDYVYNAGLRVPLGFVLPRSHPLHGSGRCSGWVSLVDIVPTLFELLGRAPPGEMAARLEGRSLAPCMQGEGLEAAPVFAESGHSFFPSLVRRRQRNDVAGRFRAVLLGDWKLIWTPFLPDEEAWQLFNVRVDPDETLDLYGPNVPAVAALKAHLREWLGRGGAEREERAISEQDLEALRSLGYVE
jgi:arylsulfatase A-like enzyme